MDWNKLQFEKVVDGEIQKWEVPKLLRGLWQGHHEGQYGTLGDLETPDGTRIPFPLTTILHRRLADLPVGTPVEIEYLGEKASKDGGRTYKDFVVGIARNHQPEDDEASY